MDRGHIADHLANKYDELYNSVPSDEMNMDRIKDTTLVNIVKNVKNMIVW